MTRDAFAHVETWIFDLDNTLYPPAIRLFDQIEVKIRDYVQDVLGVDADEADRLRAHYWRQHGTTLAGLMAEHDIDPDPFLVDVHDISFDALSPDPDLTRAIAALPGRRIVYTNGSAPYARRVLAARGLTDQFAAVYGVEDAGYRPKPERDAFVTVFDRDGLDPMRAAMFEDDTRNLRVPRDMGLKTVHVAPEPEPASHIDHHTDNLAGFLSQVV